MLQVKLEEAKTRFVELVDAALKGETVVIVKDLEAMVQLVPFIASVRRQFGSAKGTIVMGDDFEEPLPDFRAYMP